MPTISLDGMLKKSWIWSGHFVTQGRHHSWSWMSVDAPIVPWVVPPHSG